jgi:uncharacterized protein (UPF0305 family)
LDKFTQKLWAQIKIAWFTVVGFFFVIQIMVVPLFLEYAVRYVHEMDRRVLVEARKKGALK